MGFPEDNDSKEVEVFKKPKINLSELVKQDLRKIVTSVDYFDDDKYEYGKKKKKSAPEKKPEETSEMKKPDETPSPDETPVVTSSGEDAPSSTSLKRKLESDPAEKDAEPSKEVKTASGTFAVSED